MKSVAKIPVANGVWPKVTLVSVCSGEGEELRDTVRSVVGQSYPNLEYVVVGIGDGLGRSSFLREFQGRFCWMDCADATEANAALNAAFAKTSGEIMGWLEPGEMLHTKGLYALGSVMAAFPEVEWIYGRPFNFSPSGIPAGIKPLERWSRIRFLAGGNKYIHRETLFWRRSLWERAGGKLNGELGVAAEFEMFVRFFRHAQLYSVDALIGGYRVHPGNHSTDGSHQRYNDAIDAIADRELASVKGAYAAKLFRQMTKITSRIPRVRNYWHRYAMKCIYRCPGPDRPPKIVAFGDEWFVRR